MAKVHDRILEIAVTAYESDDSFLVTAIKWYGHRGATGRDLTFTAPAAAGTHEVEMGESNVPPPTHIRLVSTFQA